ncbi:uncharacterized protein TNCV_4176451 [Trichonephila clavipes]|nr:uncharacterized protein TNCV_4176451 [Trichonephila clavipes]
MVDFTYAENEDMQYMYDRASGNVRAALRMYHAQFPDQRIPNHRTFQRLHRQLRETRSFLVTRHDTGRRKAVHCSSQEESILNIVADRPGSSTRAVAYQLSRIQTLNPADCFLRLPVGGTATSAAKGLHSSCAEQLL